ncbi:IS110 family transposase [Solwaraspora sp. WMMB335]|uniref:IS110 family transposase n=1 Tax=Solwaraspora sp. WMMB335 TaxID=3404118 RepID=UPI003B953D32
MLGVGIDWTEDLHLVARIVGSEPDPAEVQVVIETRHRLLVEALVDAGYTVLPVNPDLVARRRGSAKKKDDAEDTRIACLLALDRYTELRTLVPRGQLAREPAGDRP